MIALGTKTARKLYLGSTEIARAFHGAWLCHGTADWTAGGTAPGGVKAWKSVAYGAGGGIFTAIASDGSRIYSSDGINWNKSMDLTQSIPLSCVTAYYGYHLAFPTEGATGLYSSNGYSWYTFQLPETAKWTGAVVGDTGTELIGCVAVGTKTVSGSTYTAGAFSKYGTQDWVSVNIPLGVWSAVTYGANGFVAVGGIGSRSARSADGVTWTSGSLPQQAGWYSVAYGNGRYVAVSKTYSAVSTDGLTWTGHALPGDGFSSVSFVNGEFVAMGYGAGFRSYHSANGAVWTEKALPFYGYWTNAAQGASGRAAAVGYSPYPAVSCGVYQ